MRQTPTPDALNHIRGLITLPITRRRLSQPSTGSTVDPEQTLNATPLNAEPKALNPKL